MVKAAVVLDDISTEDDVLLLRPGVNLVTGEVNFQATFEQPTSLETDVLTLASAIFACDLAFKRGEREKITRQIELTIPVVNLAVFNNILDDLRYALYVLSHDAWQVNFIQRDGVPEAPCDWRQKNVGKVLLFSGGLDSFSAAVHYGDAGKHIQLVSHVTANRVVSGAQEELFRYLQNQYSKQFTRIAVRVGGRNRERKGFPFPSDQDREDTQRTRSFLFLSLAGLAARRRGFKDVVLIAENGQMAINLPLTAARISAFSTHTAHPEFVDVMSKLLSTLLNYHIQIENPFLYMTKAEVIKSVVTNHRSMLDHTVSCWRALRVPGTKKHCGICIPCLVRRIAIESHHIMLPEYQRDLLREDIATLDSEDDGRRNLIELGEFVKLFGSVASQATLEHYYPDLANPHIDAGQAIGMYHRSALEARSVFNHYPSIKGLLN